MKKYTKKEIIKFINDNMKDIKKYEGCAEKVGGYNGTLTAVKKQLQNLK